MIYVYIINPAVLLLDFIIYTRLYDSTGLLRSLVFYPLLAFGSVLDVLVNATWFTVIFLEFPKEWLLTKRIERLKSTDGWRGDIAHALCWLLNYFQKDHCK